jgi:hypothetical protein
MAFSSLMKRAHVRWWLIMVMAQVLVPSDAMAVVHDAQTGGGYGGLIFASGVFSAIFVSLTFPELLQAYAPTFDAVFKWFFRVGVAFIALEPLLAKFGIWVDTRQAGEILLGAWSFGRMGLACYISGIADHMDNKKSF